MTLAKYILPIFLIAGTACNYSNRKFDEDINVDKIQIPTENYLPDDYKLPTNFRINEEKVRQIPFHKEMTPKESREIPPSLWREKLKAKYA